MASLETFGHLGLALAIGLLIGLERGWQSRGGETGSRVAGFRTFALIGLIGGVAGLLARAYGGIVLAGALLAVAAVLGIHFWRDSAQGKNVSATTGIAALLTVGLGALAVEGYPRLAVSAAVVATLLLSLRDTLHGWLRHIEEAELAAALRFLLLSVVILPLLPDQGFGPYQALNPYLIWWMVVLISGLSFAGYIAVKLLGPRQGLMLTAAVGALVSSTAVTIGFAHHAKTRPGQAKILAAGVLLASTVMVARIAIVVAILAPGLLRDLAWPLGAMALTGAASTLWLWWRGSAATSPDLIHSNPLDLHAALFFGLGLGVVILLARALEDAFGAVGIYGTALATGLLDVDAMTISASQLFKTGTLASIVATAITLAALTNSVAKASMGIGIGGGGFARSLAIGFGVVVIAGVGGLFIMLS